jgi:hypothetical protein
LQSITNVSVADLFLLVIGGAHLAEGANWTQFCSTADVVELISLDPRNNPVPVRLGIMKSFPVNMNKVGGGRVMFTSGKSRPFVINLQTHFLT